MNTLIIYCHPNPASFNHAILETVKEVAESHKSAVRVRDLYAMGFNPVLDGADFKAIQAGKPLADVAAEQEHISWAKRIIVIHPVWWTGLPARMKGYIDRVFSFGFAYVINEKGITGLLGDKEVIIINTTGSPSDYYEKSGMQGAIKTTSDTGIYEFCKIKVLEHIFLGAVPTVDDATRKGYLADLKKRIAARY